MYDYGRSRLSAPPPPLNFSTPPAKISQTPIPRKLLNSSPPKKKNSQPPRKSFTPPSHTFYLIMHIIHNMRQSPTSAALVVSCVFHIKLF